MFILIVKIYLEELNVIYLIYNYFNNMILPR